MPAIITGAIYEGTLYFLATTNRTIDPVVLHYSAMVEFGVFLLIMIIDARNRW